MRVLVYEDNLMWSVRLSRALAILGHDAIVFTKPDTPADEAPLAIVNLGSATLDPPTLIGTLRARGVRVIGHAGHKEKDLLSLGKEAGCDALATNSEMTFKLEHVLLRALEIAN